MDIISCLQGDSIGRYEKLKIMLEKGANPNERDPDGHPPMSIAVQNFCTRETELLAQYCDVNLPSKGTRMIPFHLTKLSSPYRENLCLLVRYGADLNIPLNPKLRQFYF